MYLKTSALNTNALIVRGKVSSATSMRKSTMVKVRFLSWVLLYPIFSIVLVTSPAYASNLNLQPIEKCKILGNNKINIPIRYEDSGHTEDWTNFLRPKGNIRTILIPLDTPDSSHVSSLQDIRNFANKVSNEYSRLSNNEMTLEIEVLNQWITLPQKGSEYEKSLEWWVKVQDAIKASDSQVDFSKFDLVIFKQDELSSTVTSAGALPMWTQVLPDGIKVLRGVYIGRDYWVSIGQGVPEAIHEIGHVFGLPDLYMQNSDGTVPVGVFDLMSTFNSNYPSQFLGWHQWKLGWISDENVICASSNSAQLFDFEVKRDKPKVVVLPISTTRLLVMELYYSSAIDLSPSLISYTVDADKFVWRSNGDSGKVSPIQMLRPINATSAPKDYGNLNLGARFTLNDSVKISNATLKIVEMSKSQVSVSYTPEGQDEIASKKESASSSPSPISPTNPSPTATPTKVSKGNVRLMTITCIKGKSSKKITAVKPKCPKGFTKK